MISVGSCARRDKKVISSDESASEQREGGLRKEEVSEVNSLREAAIDRPGGSDEAGQFSEYG